MKKLSPAKTFATRQLTVYFRPYKNFGRQHPALRASCLSQLFSSLVSGAPTHSTAHMTMAACTSTARLTCLSTSSTASHRARHRGATRGPAPRRFEGAHRASSSSSSRLRAANDGDDDGYYESWAKYPDDQGVPPEIAELLREVGDGEPDMWKTKPPWCQPWTILLTGTIITSAPEVVFHCEVAQRAGGGAHRGVVVRVPGGGPETVQGVRGVGAGVLSQEGVELL